MNAPPLLEIDGLTVVFQREDTPVSVLRDIAFAVKPGEIVCLVGESGSGKSVTALAIMRLLGQQGWIASGHIRLGGVDLTGLAEADMRQRRGRDLAMVFQEPMTSLNPLLVVGDQIAEVLIEKLGLARREARERAVALMRDVGIPDAAGRANAYPHMLSGGMRQRVMIAMAMACRPALLIADEPTTALDVTIQAQVLDLMRSLRDRHGTGILLITHDMGVVARMADRVIVLYAGTVVEMAPARTLFRAPVHPYARRLIEATPTARRTATRLAAIPGQIPDPAALPSGCGFHPRCAAAVPTCATVAPSVRRIAEGHVAACHLVAEARPS